VRDEVLDIFIDLHLEEEVELAVLEPGGQLLLVLVHPADDAEEQCVGLVVVVLGLLQRDDVGADVDFILILEDSEDLVVLGEEELHGVVDELQVLNDLHRADAQVELRARSHVQVELAVDRVLDLVDDDLAEGRAELVLKLEDLVDRLDLGDQRLELLGVGLRLLDAVSEQVVDLLEVDHFEGIEGLELLLDLEQVVLLRAHPLQDVVADLQDGDHLGKNGRDLALVELRLEVLHRRFDVEEVLEAVEEGGDVPPVDHQLLNLLHIAVKVLVLNPVLVQPVHLLLYLLVRGQTQVNGLVGITHTFNVLADKRIDLHFKPVIPLIPKVRHLLQFQVIQVDLVVED